MATNLVGPVCIGKGNACIVRVAALNVDCHPTGGLNSGIITAGIVDMTADPEIETGTVFEPKNGCGSTMYVYRQEDRLKRYNLSGRFTFFDYEMMSLLFGGTLILGAAGGDFAGKVIGYADRLFSAAPRNSIYLEVISQVFTSDSGDCAQTVGTADTPAAIGHIFGKAKLLPGSRTFENDVAYLTFTGYAENNNWLTNGPWNDFPGAGYIPNSPLVEVEYTQAQYTALLAQVGCGWTPSNLPTGS